MYNFYNEMCIRDRTRDSVIQYEIGELVAHPKFGHGRVEKVEQKTGSVNLHIRFEDGVRKIDQKWLIRSKYQKKG